MNPRPAFFLVALALVAAPARADPFDDVTLEVTPLTNGVAPYPHELVLLRIKGTYRPLINIQQLIQPALPNFGWMLLGRDTTSSTTFGGFPARGFERIMAVYPDKAGPLVIESFTHRLTVVDGTGSRVLEVKSPPLTLEVAKWQGAGGPDSRTHWWLPARDVRVTDTWSGDPNRTPRGETIRRTVIIEADGVTADQLPPAPVMRSAGIISFRGPSERETRISPDGPVARATYSWDMRPTTAYPSTVEAVKIAWFDTKSRSLRDAIIPAQRMAWAAEGAGGAAAAPPAREARAPFAATAAAAAAAFAIGLAALLLGGGEPALRLPRPAPKELRALRGAARRRDASAVRAAVEALARREPDRARVWRAAPEVRRLTAALDRHLYDAGAAPAPDLKRLAQAVAAARRSAGASRQAAQSPLAPLDGPLKRA